MTQVLLFPKCNKLPTLMHKHFIKIPNTRRYILSDSVAIGLLKFQPELTLPPPPPFNPSPLFPLSSTSVATSTVRLPQTLVTTPHSISKSAKLPNSKSERLALIYQEQRKKKTGFRSALKVKLFSFLDSKILNAMGFLICWG